MSPPPDPPQPPSCLAHGRTPFHIFLNLGCERSACTVLPVSTSAPQNASRMVEWGFMFFFWERAFLGGCVIRGWGRRWTALQIFHLYTRVCTAPPQHIYLYFWGGLHIKGKRYAQLWLRKGGGVYMHADMWGCYSPVLPNCNRGTNQTPLKTTWTTGSSSWDQALKGHDQHDGPPQKDTIY